MRRLLITILSLAFCLAPVQAGQMSLLGAGKTTAGGGGGPTFDAASSSNVAANSITTLTWSHTNSGNVMCVGLQTYNGGGVTISNVKYAGSAAFTKKTNSTSYGIGGNTEIHCSDGITLATGTNNVVITASGTNNYINAWAISVSGGNVTTPLSNFNSTTGSSTAPSISVTSATGQLIFDIVGNNASEPTITPNASQTSRFTPWAGGNILQGAGSTKPGVASTTMDWTLGSSVGWGISYGSFQ